jgi:hypothetical protein
MLGGSIPGDRSREHIVTSTRAQTQAHLAPPYLRLRAHRCQEVRAPGAVQGRQKRPAALGLCTEQNVKIITDALRIGQSRHKACALAGIPYATTFLYWMRTSGEPYISVQMAVKKAEAEFERRNVLILGVKAEKQPQFAAWLLAHAPSTKKSWREYQQALIDAQGSTFNVAAILDQVQKRRELRAAQSDPTAPINQNPTIIEHDPGDE